MYSRFGHTSPTVPRQQYNRDHSARPVQYPIIEMESNNCPDARFGPYFFTGPYGSWIEVPFGARGRPRGRVMGGAGSGFTDAYDDLSGQRGERREGRYRRCSRANGQSEDVAEQAISTTRKQPLSFEKAMVRLRQQIAKSETLYSALRSGYNSDVQAIKKHVADDILLAAWKSRMIGRRDPNVEGGDAPDDDALLELAAKIPFMKDMLREAFADVIASTIEKAEGIGRNEQIKYESSKRLKEKVILASSQVSTLLDMVSKGPEHCDALTAEMQRLKSWLEASGSNSGASGGGGDVGSDAWDGSS